jgi:hypothetical protein
MVSGRMPDGKLFRPGLSEGFSRFLHFRGCNFSGVLLLEALFTVDTTPGAHL